MISFAQNFEDVLLERLFKDKKRGFYVDVGAWDPHRYSVTRHFYDRGWRGINIEPIARRHQMFVEQRTRDINLLRLVGHEATTMRFAECVDADYLSTTVPQIADELRRTGHEISEYDVEVETLDSIFERHCPKIVDFLKIDTEGSEAEVLKTIDLTRYRPRALVVESTVPGSGLKSWDEPEAYGTWSEWEEGLIEANYVFAHFDGLNRFYLRREDSKLAGRLLLPPGIYDGIDCTDNWQGRAMERLQVIDHQREEIANLRQKADEVAGRLQQSLDAGEADRQSQDEVTAGLKEQLDTSEQDRAARLKVIERLTVERDVGRAALDEAEQAFAGRVELAVEATRIANDAANGRLAEQLSAAKRDRAARFELIERLTAELEDNRKTLAEAGETAIARIEALVEADRAARGEVVGGLVEQLGAVERDRAARFTLIERLTAELADSRKALTDAERISAQRLNAVEADRIARGEVTDRLVEQLGVVERDRAARLTLIERLTAGLDDSRRALADAEQAGAARLDAVEADRIARGEVIKSLVEQLGAVERDRAARLALIERLTAGLDDSRRALVDAEQFGAARLEAVEADRIARGEVIESLVGQLGAVERDRAARLSLIERLTVELDNSRAARADSEQAATARTEAVERDRLTRGRVIAGLEDRLASVEREAAARLELIERLTTERDESRVAAVETVRVAAGQLQVVEADRLARGEVIEGLVERLRTAEQESDEQRLSIDHLTGQLAGANEALLQRAGVLNVRNEEISRLAEQLAVTSVDVASLRRHWSYRLFSFVKGRT